MAKENLDTFINNYYKLKKIQHQKSEMKNKSRSKRKSGIASKQNGLINDGEFKENNFNRTFCI